MQTRANKNRDANVRAVADRSSASKHAGNTAVMLVDNSPESLQLSKLQLMADNSPQAAETGRLQTMVDGSPDSVAQRLLQEGLSGVPVPKQDALEEEELRPTTALAAQEWLTFGELPQGVQAKLTVGPSGDAYDLEADRVAKLVVGMTPSRPEPAQRDEGGEGLQIKPIAQRQVTQQDQPVIKKQFQEAEGRKLIQFTAEGFQVQRQANVEDSEDRTRESDHYRVELKAWIPHTKVVDPEEPLRISDWLDTLTALIPPSLDSLEYDYHSYYRGDKHIGYEGPCRVLSWVEFDWDGKALSGKKFGKDFGETHRDYDYHAWIDTLSGPIDIFKMKGTKKDKATCCATQEADGAEFALGISSSNPGIMFFAPTIDSDLKGTIHPNGMIVMTYNTDFFPSHGFKVIRNGKVVASEVTWNAISIDALGPLGAAKIFIALTNQGNFGPWVVPPQGSSAPSPASKR